MYNVFCLFVMKVYVKSYLYFWEISSATSSTEFWEAPSIHSKVQGVFLMKQDYVVSGKDQIATPLKLGSHMGAKWHTSNVAHLFSLDNQM